MNSNPSSHIPSKILILGVGNILMSDDGIGSYICSQIDAMHLPGVTTHIVHQLHVELIEDLLNYDSVIIADASIKEKEVEFFPLQPDKTQTLSSSHHLNANMLNTLFQKVYGKTTPIFLCAVRGDYFEMGEIFSVQTMKNANNAIKIICDWIKKQ